MRGIMLSRRRRIDKAVERAVEEQYKMLDMLLRQGRNTLFGHREGLRNVHNAEQFAYRVRLFDYASYEG